MLVVEITATYMTCLIYDSSFTYINPIIYIVERQPCSPSFPAGLTVISRLESEQLNIVHDHNLVASIFCEAEQQAPYELRTQFLPRPARN